MSLDADQHPHAPNEPATLPTSSPVQQTNPATAPDASQSVPSLNTSASASQPRATSTEPADALTSRDGTQADLQAVDDKLASAKAGQTKDRSREEADILLRGNQMLDSGVRQRELDKVSALKEQQRQRMSVFSSDYVTDQFQAVGDGTMNALSSTADVASYVVSKIGLRDYDPNEFTSQKSTVTHTADFVRPVTQFLAEMSMIGGAVKKVGQAGLGGFRAGRGLLATAQGTGRSAAVARGAGTWAQSMAVSAVAFDAREETLVFSKDADENFIVGRLKNAIDDGTAGFVLGKAVEGVLKGVARVFKASAKGDTAGAAKFLDEARQAIEKSDAGKAFAKKVVGTGSKITEEQALESASKIAYGLHKASGGTMSVDEVFASVDVMKLSEMDDLLKQAGLSGNYAGDEVSAAAGKVLAEGGDEEAALAAALKEIDTKAAAEPIALAEAPAKSAEKADGEIPLAKDDAIPVEPTKPAADVAQTDETVGVRGDSMKEPIVKFGRSGFSGHFEQESDRLLYLASSPQASDARTAAIEALRANGMTDAVIAEQGGRIREEVRQGLSAQIRDPETKLNLRREAVAVPADPNGQMRLFQAPAGEIKGAAELLKSGLSIIGLSKSADVSTLIHEMLHGFHLAGVNADLFDNLGKSLGVVDGKWGRADYEKAARMFERYAFDGHLDDVALAPHMKQIASWMKSVYQSIDNSEISEEVSPEVRRAFDVLLGKEKLISDISAMPHFESIKTQVKDFIRNGVEVEDAVMESMTTWVNMPRRTEDIDVQQVLKNTAQVLDDVLTADRGGVQSLKSAEEAAIARAEELGVSPDTLFSMLTSAKQAEKLKTDLVAYRIVENSVAKKMADTARRLEANPNDEALKALGEDTLKLLVAVKRSVSSITADSARITTFGRIKTGLAAIDEGTLIRGWKELVDGKLGGDARAKVLRGVAAAGGDAGKVGKVVGGAASAYARGGRKMLNVWLEYYTNSLLSGPKTLFTSMISASTNTAILPIEKWAGGAIDFVRTGGDSTALRHAWLLTRGLVDSAVEAFDFGKLAGEAKESPLAAGRRSFMDERSIIDGVSASEGDAYHAIDSRNWEWMQNGTTPAKSAARIVNVAGLIFRLPSRFLTTTDELFKQFNARAYVRARGYEAAAAQGLDGDAKAFDAFMEAFVSDAFDANGRLLDVEALQYAQQSTFSNPLAPDSLSGRVQQIVQHHPSLRLFFPFVRTPTNIIKRAWQYTPGLNLLEREMRQGLLSPNPRIRAQYQGRFALGSAFWTIAVASAFQGRITGKGPENADARKLLLDTGWRPYSVKIENEDGSTTYVDFNRLDTLGSLLGIAADYVDIGTHLDDQGVVDVANAVLAATVSNLSSKSYTVGLTQLGSILKNPKSSVAGWMRQVAGAHVPNALSQANPDDVTREARTWLDKIMSRLPGFSRDLPPKRNIFGEPVPSNRSINPVAWSTSIGDDVKDELAKFDHGLTTDPSAKWGAVDMHDFTDKSGRDAYDFWREQTGNVRIGGITLAQSLSRLIKTNKYQQIEDHELRLREIRRVLDDYRDAAKEKTAVAFPELRAARKASRKTAKPVSPVLERILKS